MGSWIRNLRIKWKLLCMVALPLLGFVVTSSVLSLEGLEARASLQEVATLSQLTERLGPMIHERD